MDITGPLLYFLIFFAKVIEVSISTLRIVLINRGLKKLGSMLAFVEVLIWLYIVNAVLNDVTSDFFKVFAYCAAFACGNYIGVMLEEKLAIGMSVMEIFALDGMADAIATKLREEGYGVTTIDSQGKDNKVTIIKTFIKRKQIETVTQLIKDISPKAIITVEDVKQIQGGYIKK